MFGYLTLLTGLALSIVAAWFAVEGIMAIFAGLAIYAMIMGIVIEAGKVVGVTWIYRHWAEKTRLKYVMIPFVLVMMLLTSMGIFGLLSKAHLEQTAPVTNNSAKIERLDQRITRERSEIADAETEINQLDETLQVLIDANIISDPVRGARVVRINQQPQRDFLKNTIDESMDSIDEYEDQKLVYNQELNELELEVGPVKYIAALIYENPEDSLDEAVRIVIIAFIFVFDPMAVLLLMAGNYTLMGRVGAAPVRKEIGSKCPECYDPVLGAATASKCNVCHGTERVDGYYLGVPIKGNFSADINREQPGAMNADLSPGRVIMGLAILCKRKDKIYEVRM